MVYKPVDFVINPVHKKSFLRDADRNGVYLTTIIKDVQKAFDKQTVKTYIRRDMKSFDWSNFFRLNDIYLWLQDLAHANSRVMTLMSIGTTHEHRDIKAVRIALRAKKDLRSTIIIEGGIHAREWISPAVVTYLIHQILHADSSSDSTLKEVATTYEWYFVPVMNPDGYEHSHTGDRLWRKNRHDDGVDLNRNFDHVFGTEGISWSPKSNLYCGSKAFSEKETKAMADFIRSKSETLEFYVSFHSYGQYMILPYANLKKHADNYDEVAKLCKRVAQKIAAKYDTKYKIGTAFDTVGYLTSGVSGCWVKSTFKIPYVVTFELRDRGHEGFALSLDKIMPTCQETMDGLLTLFDPRQTQLKAMINGAFKIFGSLTIVFSILFIVVRFA